MLVTAVTAEQDSRRASRFAHVYKRFNSWNSSSRIRYTTVHCYAFPAIHRLSDDSVESGLEPFDGVLLGDLVRSANGGLASSSSRDSYTLSHPVNSALASCSNVRHEACFFPLGSSSTTLFCSAPEEVGYQGVYSHAAVKVHSVDTNGRVVLDSQIDVF